ncbi:MAG: PEP-CTERM sorting domain-containing protein [Verrucomicrobia bacterium]|nr:PEP-CTERM sorting domain-containing protein [Verrucomicrobiota bacterium]
MKKSILALTALLSAYACNAQITVVSYAPETYGTGIMANRTVTGNLDLNGDSINTDSRVTFRSAAFGGSGTFSTGAGYTGPVLQAFLKGEAINVNNKNLDNPTLTPFAVRYQTNSAGQSGRFTMGLLFESQYNAKPVSFGEGSSMTIAGTGSGGLFSNFDSLGAVRWMVSNNDTVYVSQTLIANNNTGGRVLDETELSSEMWAVLNVQNAFDFNLGTLNFDTPTEALTDLTGFGIFMYRDSFEQVRTWIGFNTFEVVAIPEPSTYVALFGLSALGIVVWQRRRKSPLS